MIDLELKQKAQKSLTTVEDSARLAGQIQIAHWVNETLGELSLLNDAPWYRRISYTTVNTDQSKIVFPFFWKTIERIYIGSKKYEVGQASDYNAKVIVKNYNTIEFPRFTVPAGTEIFIEGTFRPNNLTTDGTTEELQQLIDIDPLWIGLLKLSVLIKYAGTVQMNTPQWYAQYTEQKKLFKDTAKTVVGTHGVIKNRVVW